MWVTITGSMSVTTMRDAGDLVCARPDPRPILVKPISSSPGNQPQPLPSHCSRGWLAHRLVGQYLVHQCGELQSEEKQVGETGFKQGRGIAAGSFGACSRQLREVERIVSKLLVSGKAEYVGVVVPIAYTRAVALHPVATRTAADNAQIVRKRGSKARTGVCSDSSLSPDVVRAWS
jgi:hypothetical protein